MISGSGSLDWHLGKWLEARRALRSAFIISNRKISNRASQILKANMLLICPYSRISNCQSLGRKNKHEILKTDRTICCTILYHIILHHTNTTLYIRLYYTIHDILKTDRRLGRSDPGAAVLARAKSYMYIYIYIYIYVCVYMC